MGPPDRTIIERLKSWSARHTSTGELSMSSQTSLGALVADLEDLASSIDRTLQLATNETVKTTMNEIAERVNRIHEAWSGSCLGYHSRVYYSGLQSPPPNTHFSAIDGLSPSGMWTQTRGDWQEFNRQEIFDQLLSSPSPCDLELVKELDAELRVALRTHAETMGSIMAAYATHLTDPHLMKLKEQTDQLSATSYSQFCDTFVRRHTGSQVRTADMRVLAQFRAESPPHIDVLAHVQSLEVAIDTLSQLNTHVKSVTSHLQRRLRASTGPSSTRQVSTPTPPDADITNGIDLLLVTVTKIETQVLLQLLTEATGAQYGHYFGRQKSYFVFPELAETSLFVVRSEMGGETVGGSHDTVRTAIDEVRPRAIVMVGIAYGVDREKQQLGSVLVSQQLQHCDPQRVGTGSSGEVNRHARGDRARASRRLLDRFRMIEVEWPHPIQFGLMLSGAQLIDNLEYRNELLERFPEAIGGEMEGAGLYAGAMERAEWIVVKAVCDYADGRKSESKSTNQQLAASRAASFVVAAIKRGAFRQG